MSTNTVFDFLIDLWVDLFVYGAAADDHLFSVVLLAMQRKRLAGRSAILRAQSILGVGFPSAGIVIQVVNSSPRQLILYRPGSSFTS